MQDDTTTSEASEDSQALVDNTAQLEREATTEAVEPSEETTSTSNEAESTPEEIEPAGDDEADIRDWATKKNLPLDEPLKLAKMYRDAEKQMHQATKEKGQLDKAVSSANQAADIEDVQALRNELTALTFKINNNVDAETEQQMVEILDDRPWLAGDLDAVLLMAKGRSASTEAARVLEARKAGKDEALATVAQAERAAPPKASASTRETPAQFLTDEEVGRLSPAEYQEAKAAGRIQF